MAKLFTMDHTKDRKLVGQEFNWNLDGKTWKVKFKEIDKDNYYQFVVRSKDCEYEEFFTLQPNLGDITQ